MKIAVEKGRSVRPDLKIGICGVHGGDPRSIVFCHHLGLNYVSCSAYQIPIARLTAAQVALQDRPAAKPAPKAKAQAKPTAAKPAKARKVAPQPSPGGPPFGGQYSSGTFCLSRGCPRRPPKRPWTEHLSERRFGRRCELNPERRPREPPTAGASCAKSWEITVFC
jgi:hypothetical protein